MKLFYTICFFLGYLGAAAQPKTYPTIASPLDLPISLSGTFCELRNSHFHAGLDFRTNGEEGHKIYAVDEGYISRIRISGSGYGKALYIDHPTGYTSVYGHLQKFTPEIEAWLYKVHHHLQSAQIDTMLPPNILKVKRREWVAVSGNTGGSQGPHLHFEMRETESEAPVNPKLFGLKINDNTPPYPGQLMLQAFDNEAAPSNEVKIKLTKKGSYFGLPNSDTLKVNATKIGISLFAEDKMEGSENNNGIYELKLKVEEETHFGFRFSELSSFDDGRKIAGHMEHRTHKITGAKYHRCYRLPGNYLPVYFSLKNNGFIDIENEPVKVALEVSDFNKNTSRIQFYLLHDSTANIFSFQPKKFQQILFYKKAHEFEAEGISVQFKDSTFYENVYFNYSVTTGNATSKIFSDMHQLHTDLDPCQREFEITLFTKNLPDSLRHKALAVRENFKGNRAPLYGEWNGDESFTFSSKEFGKFYISIDTTPPKINPVNIYANKLMRAENTVRFKVSDNLTGVNKIDLFINGKWMLTEYDAKNSLVWHKFEPSLEQGTHELVFEVTDRMNNKQTFKTTFRR